MDKKKGTYTLNVWCANCGHEGTIEVEKGKQFVSYGAYCFFGNRKTSSLPCVKCCCRCLVKEGD